MSLSQGDDVPLTEQTVTQVRSACRHVTPPLSSTPHGHVTPPLLLYAAWSRDPLLLYALHLGAAGAALPPAGRGVAVQGGVGRAADG